MDGVNRMRAAGTATVPSTLGLEKKTNPFLRPDSSAIRKSLGMEKADDVAVFGEIRSRKDKF
jgi:hydroxyacylglutathione hydrolase